MLVTLCLTVTTSYGVLYYAFTVLATSISDDTGWSRPAVTGAFSAGSLLGAVLGIAVGRQIQRRGPRLVMSAGSALGTAAVVLVALAPSYPVFVLGWLLVGAASAATFYPPAFAALTRWFGPGRVRAITTLTLVAGFSSTVFAPLTAALDAAVGWRGAYLVLAAVLLLTAPALALALDRPWHRAAAVPAPASADREILLSRRFLLVAGAGSLTSVAVFASLVSLVPLMLDRGLGTYAAAWVLGLSGAGQVVGRLAYPALDRRLPPPARAALVIGTLGASLGALAVVDGPVAVLVAIAVLGGAARGLFTLVSATVVADHWGYERHAALNGVYYAPLGIGAALAPALGAATAAVTGYDGLFAILAAICLVAAALAAAAGRDDRAGRVRAAPLPAADRTESLDAT